jgi:branched-chain amino acid transport system permease protein
VFYLNLALAGIAIGSIASLSGIGLIITYRATGVFNLAFGGIAMMTAYLTWQLVNGWGVPLAVATLIALGFAVGFGAFIDQVVFRQLQRRGATPAESLVATLGLLVLLIGSAIVVWGPSSQTNVPSLLPTSSVSLGGGTVIGVGTLWQLGIVLVATLLILLVTARTHLGTEIRAVVDRRDLAELTAVNANRISALGWGVGAGFAGLTGILIAPQFPFNPYLLTLVVLETFAVPVIARLYSLPVAIASGLGIGVAASEMAAFHPSTLWLNDLWQSLSTNLFVIALFVALLVIRRLEEFGGSGDMGAAKTFATRRGSERPMKTKLFWYSVGLVLLFLPLLLNTVDLQQAELFPALAVIFVSLVAVTGYSGQISLGQVGYAGLGALFTAKFAAGDLFGLHRLPFLLALLLGMTAAGLIGFATGYQAIRRRGLFLALTTFAVGVLVSRFVFQEPYSGVNVTRPTIFGVSLNSEPAFYVFELICLGFALLVARNLRSGRLGRALVAMRDNEDGARSLGIDLSVLKVFIFSTSSALAGLGGALLAQSGRAFDPNTFDPLEGLFWFTAVVVFGADSAVGAVIAAGFAVTIDVLVGQPDAYAVGIGLLALYLGHLPGGAIDGLRRLTARLLTPRTLLGRFAAELPPAAQPTLSDAGRQALARVRAEVAP